MEIASLGIRITTDGAAQATAELDKLGPAAVSAEKAIDALAKTGELGIRIDTSGATQATVELDKLGPAAASVKKAVEDLTKTSKQSGGGLGISSAAAREASASIDAQIGKLQTLAATHGLNARQATLYKLGLEGATKAQLDAASSAIKLTEAYDRGQSIGEGFKTGLKAIAAAAIAAGAAAAYAVVRISGQVANYKQLSEVIGDTASAVASLQLAADVSGKSIDEAAQFSIRLTKALSKTDDESKLAGRALAAIGLEFDSFKAKSPVTQLEAIAKALKGFDDGPGKTAVLEALVKGGAQLLPFLNDLGDQQSRQLRLTDEQIARADQFTKANARSASALKSLAQTIVIESLDSITDLTGALKDAIEQTYGLGKGADSLKGNTAISEFADEGSLALARLADVALTVGRGIKTVADSYALAAALIGTLGPRPEQLEAMQQITKDAREEALKSAANSASITDALEKRIAARKAAAAASPGRGAANDPRRLDGDGGKAIDVSTLVADKPAKVKQGRQPKGQVTEKDLLGFDIALIKRALDEQVSVYKDAESILEATRQAGLVEERAYYASKLGFIRLNEAEQVRALERENASFKESIESKRGTPQDRLESQRKIADNEQRIIDLRQRAAAAEVVIGIQTDTALRRITQGYRDAEDAAQAYLDTLVLVQKRDLEGAGLGNQERGRRADRAQIEDKFSQERRALEKGRRDGEANSPGGRLGPEAKEKYDTELKLIRESQAKALEIYDHGVDARLQQERDWATGAAEAYQNYLADAANTAKQTEALFTNAFKGLEDALVSFVTTGKLDFKSLANSIIADLARIQIKKALASITESATSSGGWISSLISLVSGSSGASSGFGAGGFASAAGISGGRALGGPVSPGSMVEVNESGRPEILNAGGKQFLMMGNQGGSVTPASSEPSVVNNISVGAGVTRGEVMSLLQIYGQQIKGDILQSMNNRGAFART